MNEAAEAFENAVHSSHRVTRITFWIVAASVSYLVGRIAFSFLLAV